MAKKPTLGQRLLAARTRAGKTRRAVSLALDITEETIRAWEADEGPGPRLRQGAPIADLYGVTLEWLARGEGPGPSA